MFAIQKNKYMNMGIKIFNIKENTVYNLKLFLN